MASSNAGGAARGTVAPKGGQRSEPPPSHLSELLERVLVLPLHAGSLFPPLDSCLSVCFLLLHACLPSDVLPSGSLFGATVQYGIRGEHTRAGVEGRVFHHWANMATARTYAGDGKNAEVDWGMMTNLDTNAEYISIIFITIIAIIVISALRCASRAVHLCGSNGTANG